MKLFAVAAICCVGLASALPLLDTAVTNGVLLEEKASRPTFAKGIRTDCEYSHHTGRTLGHVPAEGDRTPYESVEKAKAVCDEMGPNCGGVLEEVPDGSTEPEFTLWHGHQLKVGNDDQIMHLKTLCALPLPISNFMPGDSANLHNAILKANDDVEGLRWKLANGPEFARYDDGRDHGKSSRLADGRVNVFTVDECIEVCAKKSDCASGHFCAVGGQGAAGSCFLSGDWDAHGVEVDELVCSQAQNFRKKHDWVKPVMRTDDGQYIKHQWHSKKPIDEARAEAYMN